MLLILKLTRTLRFFASNSFSILFLSLFLFVPTYLNFYCINAFSYTVSILVLVFILVLILFFFSILYLPLPIYHRTYTYLRTHRRSVVAAGSFGALVTLMFSYLFLVETPRFVSHVMGEHQKAVEDLAKQVSIFYLFIHLFVCLFVCLFTHLSID